MEAKLNRVACSACRAQANERFLVVTLALGVPRYSKFVNRLIQKNLFWVANMRITFCQSVQFVNKITLVLGPSDVISLW